MSIGGRIWEGFCCGKKVLVCVMLILFIFGFMNMGRVRWLMDLILWLIRLIFCILEFGSGLVWKILLMVFWLVYCLVVRVFCLLVCLKLIWFLEIWSFILIRWWKIIWKLFLEWIRMMFCLYCEVCFWYLKCFLV